MAQSLKSVVIDGSEAKLFEYHPWLLSAFLVCIGPAEPFLILHSSHSTKDLIVGTVVSLVFALVGLVIYEKTVFIFDPVSRMIIWRRVGVFRRSSGTMRFEEISDVVLSISRGDKGRDMYNIEFKCGAESISLLGRPCGGSLAPITPQLYDEIKRLVTS